MKAGTALKGLGLLNLALLLSLAFGETKKRLFPSLKEGRRLYRILCATCHGIKGQGDGPMAPFLRPPPRDFTRGIFKWRSTPSGTLPTDDDLVRTIWRGIKGTAMPSFGDLLSERQIRSLVAYIKTFSPRFQREKPGTPIPIPPSPPITPKTIARGKQLYEQLQCWQCHGESGKGDGPAALTLRDEKGRPIKPFDFTTGVYRCGGRPEDIYRTFVTGIDGTPMPSFADALPDPDDRWALVHFILSLNRRRPWYQAPALPGLPQ